MRTYTSVAAALLAGFELASAAPICGGGSNGSSSLLYVATYPAGEGELGKVTTLKLSKSSLESVGSSDGCGPYPSWLTQAGDVLYCVNEAWGSTSGGALASLKISADGSLTQLNSIGTLGGPVSTIVYGNEGRGLAVANYEGGGINTFNIADPSALVALQTDKFPDPTTNSSFSQQAQARPHEAILDPSGDFLVFPDLGSDLIRVFKVDKDSLQYTELASHELPRESGPRHAAFLKAGDKTFLYLVTELSNNLIGFSVDYSDDGLSFTEIYKASTHGSTDPLPEGTAAAEIHVSPDGKFLTLSSRLESSQQYTTANGTVVPSDPLITFSIDAATGDLTHVQTAPAGGVNPRHFSFNKDGSLVASAAQADGRVVVFARDTTTGEIGKTVAEFSIAGMPNFVMFKE